jgi:hypothetical protein
MRKRTTDKEDFFEIFHTVRPVFFYLILLMCDAGLVLLTEHVGLALAGALTGCQACAH